MHLSDHGEVRFLRQGSRDRLAVDATDDEALAVALEDTRILREAKRFGSLLADFPTRPTVSSRPAARVGLRSRMCLSDRDGPHSALRTLAFLVP